MRSSYYFNRFNERKSKAFWSGREKPAKCRPIHVGRPATPSLEVVLDSFPDYSARSPVLKWCSRPLSREAFCCICASRILSGAFGAIVILSARFCGFLTGRSTLFCKMFWRGMKENDKYANISNSVDTRGVCWPLWWGYFNDQSTNKTRKKPENLKFEIWFTEDQDVQMR